jgi:hypothetical protein
MSTSLLANCREAEEVCTATTAILASCETAAEAYTSRMLAGDLSLEAGQRGLTSQLGYLEGLKRRLGVYKDALLAYSRSSSAADAEIYAAYDARLGLLGSLVEAQKGLVTRTLAAVARVLESPPAYPEPPPYADASPPYSET